MRLIMVVSILVVLFSCADREVSAVEPRAEREAQQQVAPVRPPADILFVIDNSGSMKEEQASLIANFPRFIDVLEGIEGGLPDLNIGVVTTDLGSDNEVCGDGEGGRLRSSPGTCSGPLGKSYINTVEANYAGTLEEAFSCVADVGTGGCGFEQPLEASRLALSGINPGFLRDGAILAVVFITDEDDCSISNQAMLDPAGDVGSFFGPLDSFRCFEFGSECDPDTPRAVGETLRDCKPRADSPYMYGVSGFADDLLALKSTSNNILVAGIYGPATDATVIWKDEEQQRFDLVPACESEFGEAQPGFRMGSFLSRFAGSTSQSICQGDLGPALEYIAERLALKLDASCIVGNIDSDPSTPQVEADCSVWDVVSVSGDPDPQQAMPQCDSPSSPSQTPCWTLSANPDKCAAQHTQLELSVVRGDGLSGLDFTEVRCAVY
jgi:hypothetical protein